MLPLTPPVVVVVREPIERAVFGDERTRAMPRSIRAEDTKACRLSREPRFAKNRERVVERNVRPRRMRLEAKVLIEQDPLRAFENDVAPAPQRIRERLRPDDPYGAREALIALDAIRDRLLVFDHRELPRCERR